MISIIEYFKSFVGICLSKKQKDFLLQQLNTRKTGTNMLFTSRVLTYFIKISSYTLSIVLIVFGFFQYIIPYINQHYQVGVIAQAEYIGTVVSWNGSYQIVDVGSGNQEGLKNKISVGSSLLVNDGSQVSVKTNNNAYASITGPAKITFHKQNNQIIVDVSYSQQLNISKGGESTVSSSTDVLVLKTDKKTIVAKDNSFDLSLSTHGTEQSLTSHEGVLLVSSIDNDALDSTIELRAKESVILNSEKKLFAKQDSKIDQKNGQHIKNSNLKKDDTTSLDIDLSIANSGGIGSGILALLVNSGVEDKYSGINETDAMIIASNTQTSTIDDLGVEKDELIVLQNESSVLNDAHIAMQHKEHNLDELLIVKPILDGKLLELLDKLYEGYYYTYNKDITKVADLIISLCSELSLRCDSKNLIGSLNKVNAKVINNYLITPDIKLVQ